ncbi:MAG: hypothetical protein Q9167_005127 [Letrouitia subvulpina]
MPSKKASVSGGWNPAKVNIFKGVNLPEKTKCKTCKKIKAITNYSNKQQATLRARITTQGARASAPTAEVITCRVCVGGQVHELCCMMCNEVKGLHAFAKAQRKDPDNASEEKWATNEWRKEDLAEDDSESDTDIQTNAYDTGSDTEGESESHLSIGLNEMNLQKHDAGERPDRYSAVGGVAISESDLLGSYSDEESHGGTSPKQNTQKKWTEFAKKSGRELAYTGYDPQGLPHRQVHSLSSVASESSRGILTSRAPGEPYKNVSPCERNNDTNADLISQQSNNRRFAKVNRGARPATPPLIEALKASATGRTVSYSDEESSDEDWATLPDKVGDENEPISKDRAV